MRLIDADALKKEVNKKNVVGRFNTLLLIDNAPTVNIDWEKSDAYLDCIKRIKSLEKENDEVRQFLKANFERPQGKWIYHKAEGYFLPYMECSVCHTEDMLDGISSQKYKLINKFCCNCGAKMSNSG